MALFSDNSHPKTNIYPRTQKYCDILISITVKMAPDSYSGTAPKCWYPNLQEQNQLRFCTTSMLQLILWIFWPRIRSELEVCYKHCQHCTENRNSRAQAKNEIDKGDLFDSFFPNTCVQMDFKERAVGGIHSHM